MTSRAIWARRIIGTAIAGALIVAPLLTSTTPTAAVVQKPAVTTGTTVTTAGSSFSQTALQAKNNSSSGTTLQHGFRPAITANNAVDYYRKLMQINGGKSAFGQGAGNNNNAVHVQR